MRWAGFDAAFLILATAAAGAQELRLRPTSLGGPTPPVGAVGVLVEGLAAVPVEGFAFSRGGRRRRAQVEVLAVGADGRPAALRLVGPLGGRGPLRIAIGRGAPAPQPVRVRARTGGGIVLANGLVSLELVRDPAVAFRRLRRRGARAPIIAAARFGRGDGEAELEVVEDGPWRAVVFQSGRIRRDDGTAMGVERWVILEAGSAAPRVETHLAPLGSLPLGGPLELVLEGLAPLVSARAGDGAPSDLRRGPAALSSTPRGTVTWADARGAQEVEATALRMLTAVGPLEVRVRDFTRLVPGRVALVERRLGLATLVSGDYPWAQGVRPGRALRFDLAPEGSAPPRGYGEILLMPAGGRPRTARGGVLATIEEVVGRELVAGRDPFEGLGEADAGDFVWAPGRAGNLEFDSAGGLLALGLAREDGALLASALRAARHLVARDLDLDATGLPLRHGRGHRGGGVELGHVWLEGFARIALCSGDPRLWREAERLRTAFLEFARALEPDTLNLRSLAWGLLSATALAEIWGGEEERRLVARWSEALAEMPGEPWLELERVGGAEGPWIVSSWVAAGILGEAVFRVRGLFGRAPRLVRRYLDLLEGIVEVAWDDQTGRLARSVVLDEDGRPAASRAPATGEAELFFALGLRRGVRLGGPPAWAELAERVEGCALEHLHLPEKRYRGKEVSQLLWLRSRHEESWPQRWKIGSQPSRTSRVRQAKAVR